MDVLPIEIFQDPNCETKMTKNGSGVPMSTSDRQRKWSDSTASTVSDSSLPSEGKGKVELDMSIIPSASSHAPPLASVTVDQKRPSEEYIDSPTPEDEHFQAWTNFIHKIHRPILAILHMITQCSARNPWTTICMSIYFSTALLVAGFFTGFTIDDANSIWTPQYSATLHHEHWINYESGFPTEPRFLTLFFHANGKNVLGLDEVQHVFEALNVITDQPDWEMVCTRDEDGNCRIHGIPEFWNQSEAIFMQEVQSNPEVVQAMSSLYFPNGNRVDENAIFGFPERAESGWLLQAKSYTLNLQTQRMSSKTPQFELDIVSAILELDDEWAAEHSNDLRVEVFAERSFDDEFDRAIRKDIPLVPAVFVIMAFFTCCVFFKRDRVRSRMLLGISAVVAVVLSLMSGYGLMFICGVKFTSMTPILPFVIFGIGLDDAYIIAFAYDRRDSQKDVLERVRDTVDDIGISITLTTMTSMLAFGLGSISSIPVVYWLCYYAVTTIGFVLVYQVTFFVACIVLDERRIEARRSDCMPCVHVQAVDEEDGTGSMAGITVLTNDCDTSFAPNEEISVQQNTHKEDEQTNEFLRGKARVLLEATLASTNDGKLTGLDTSSKTFKAPKEDISIEQTEDIMTWYANFLLNPCVQIFVICGFAVLLVFAALSAAELRQEFDLVDVIPSDSYVADYFDAVELYTARKTTAPGIYFRDVDQSNPEIQEQMEEYINDIVAMDGVVFQPEYFWLRSFKQFVNETDHVANKTFNEQLHVFLSDPMYRNLYKDDIVLDQKGDIVASRCYVYLDNVNLDDVQEQIDALRIEREVTLSQSINQDVSEENAKFFNFVQIYNIWAFYTASVEELILTAITGVAAVTFVSLILVPHWTAAIFVLPLICMLYIDLLGVLQWAGVTINVVSFIALVMSIGLMVDFVMHVLLRYHELSGTPEDRTIEMLQTMGKSVLLGATSTLLGTMSLVFSGSAIFATVFISFVGLVMLGAGHGLILLPVILSRFGPRMEHETDGPKRSKIMEHVQNLYLFP